MNPQQEETLKQEWMPQGNKNANREEPQAYMLQGTDLPFGKCVERY
jgi:hypothetical protein